MKQYRQGDLLFIETDAPPAGRRKEDRVILASTVTGHTHSLTAGEVFVAPENRERASFYVVVPVGGGQVVHAEHNPIALPEGTYEVVRQREVTGYVQD